MKKKLKIFSIMGIFLMVCLLASSLLNSAQAGGLTVISVDMSDAAGNNVYTVSTDIETTTIVFTPETAINDDDGIQLDFASDFVINAGIDVVPPGDVTITQANGGLDLTVDVMTRVDADTLQIDIATESDTPLGAVTITIDNAMLKTPTTTGTKRIDIATYFLGADGDFAGGDDVLEDAGAAGIVIGTNQVTISGTVDPTLTLAVSPTTCALGTLSSTKIATCSYGVTVDTNATDGYDAFIRRPAVSGGLLSASGDEITPVADGAVTPGGSGAAEYGVSTSKAAQTILQNTTGETCDDLDIGGGQDGAMAMPASALTAADQKFASAAAPASADLTTMCHAAAIIGTTPAGVYTQTVTLTVTGKF